MTKFPDSCIRGIRKKEWITPENKVAGLAFDPDERTKKNRSDDGLETSINWEDNKTVLEFSIKTSGFEHGAVRLSREQIDQINKEPTPENYLSYERDKLKNNPYHGNIVFRSNLSTVLKRTLAASLAQRSTTVIRKEDIQTNLSDFHQKSNR